MEEFIRSVPTVFDEPFGEFNYERIKISEDEYFASVYYRCGEIYVEIIINIHPLDEPEHCYIVLGEGAIKFPESDWNSIELSQLHLGEGEFSVSKYELNKFQTVHDALVVMKNDLFDHAAEFLRGDSKEFRHKRAEMNRKREPYKIHEPVSFLFGKYKVRDEPESVKLKEKYSKD